MEVQIDYTADEKKIVLTAEIISVMAYVQTNISHQMRSIKVAATVSMSKWCLEKNLLFILVDIYTLEWGRSQIIKKNND